MSTVTFTWPSGPKEVVVTGDFDNWKGTLPLVKLPGNEGFTLTVPIQPSKKTSEKLYFKFIVDGVWSTSNNYGLEANAEGITNNFIDLDTTTASTIIPESGLPIVTATNNSNMLKRRKSKKRIKIQRRIRKNKLTGEETVVSEKKTIIHDSSVNDEGDDENDEDFQDASNILDETIKTTDSTPSPSPHTASSNFATTSGIVIPSDPSSIKELNNPIPLVDEPKKMTSINSEAKKIENENNFKHTVLPREDTKFNSLAGEPGLVFPRPEDGVIKEFSETRDVDQDELNTKLNKQLDEDSTFLHNSTSPKDEGSNRNADINTASDDVAAEKNKLAGSTAFTDGRNGKGETHAATASDSFKLGSLPREEYPKTATISGEPGIQIPKNPENIKAFSEFSNNEKDIDALNKNLNSEIAKEAADVGFDSAAAEKIDKDINPIGDLELKTKTLDTSKNGFNPFNLERDAEDILGTQTAGLTNISETLEPLSLDSEAKKILDNKTVTAATAAESQLGNSLISTSGKSRKVDLESSLANPNDNNNNNNDNEFLEDVKAKGKEQQEKVMSEPDLVSRGEHSLENTTVNSEIKNTASSTGLSENAVNNEIKKATEGVSISDVVDNTGLESAAESNLGKKSTGIEKNLENAASLKTGLTHDVTAVPGSNSDIVNEKIKEYSTQDGIQGELKNETQQLNAKVASLEKEQKSGLTSVKDSATDISANIKSEPNNLVAHTKKNIDDNVNIASTNINSDPSNLTTNVKKNIHDNVDTTATNIKSKSSNLITNGKKEIDDNVAAASDFLDNNVSSGNADKTVGTSDSDNKMTSVSGGPGLVIPNKSQTDSAFNKVRDDVDQEELSTKLNDELKQKEGKNVSDFVKPLSSKISSSAAATTVGVAGDFLNGNLSSGNTDKTVGTSDSDNKMTSVSGGPGLVIPNKSQTDSAFNKVRDDVDQEELSTKLNDELKQKEGKNVSDFVKPLSSKISSTAAAVSTTADENNTALNKEDDALENSITSPAEPMLKSTITKTNTDEDFVSAHEDNVLSRKSSSASSFKNTVENTENNEGKDNSRTLDPAIIGDNPMDKSDISTSNIENATEKRTTKRTGININPLMKNGSKDDEKKEPKRRESLLTRIEHGMHLPETSANKETQEKAIAGVKKVENEEKQKKSKGKHEKERVDSTESKAQEVGVSKTGDKFLDKEKSVKETIKSKEEEGEKDVKGKIKTEKSVSKHSSPKPTKNTTTDSVKNHGDKPSVKKDRHQSSSTKKKKSSSKSGSSKKKPSGTKSTSSKKQPSSTSTSKTMNEKKEKKHGFFSKLKKIFD
ncbi:uncharacterized protein SCODWIG_00355 [Saccharomycodes ludwigii]|uniref:AMP-activated protein kinase glycogen-binding domain-containing protein n=1 Tax=Saccharomycodes ludwigii TaxID=36035 RepID=A0A376B292_9ASCO|nr:uncharacterized protein SCODWIG_00355 [Saccharomycodes ludwigii]